jgi:hypothetical protein
MASYIRFVILPKDGEHWYSMDLETSSFDRRTALTLTNTITAIDADKETMICAQCDDKNAEFWARDYFHIESVVFGNEDFQMWVEEIIRFKGTMSGGLFTAGIKKPHQFDSIVKCIPIYVRHITDLQINTCS